MFASRFAALCAVVLVLKQNVADAQAPFFSVTSSVPAGACVVSNGGTCVGDGDGLHGNNERCTIAVLQTTGLSAPTWDVEAGWDFLTIGGTGYTGVTSPAGVVVNAGSTFTWLTDSSVVGQGFTVCAVPYVSTTAAPFPSTAFFVVTASTPAGSCLTTNGGTCVTDGAGAHANNERCTISVIRSTILTVSEWGVEQGFDFLTVNGVGYTGATSPQGVSVAAGTTFTWLTDSSVTGVGFTVCGGGVSIAPTTAAPYPTGTFFVVTSAVPAGSCLTTNGGTCVTDGTGAHANNERCTISVIRSTILTVSEWGVEQGFDFLTINGVGYTGATRPQAVSVTAGSTFTWFTDGSVVGVGFTVCADATATSTAPTSQTPTTTPTLPAPTTAAPYPSTAFFVVTLALPAGSCFTTNGGTCVTDGVGAHANNERCTISVLRDTLLGVTQWGVEQGFDFLQIGATRFTGTVQPQGVFVAAGSSMTWSTDASVVLEGFIVCADPSASATPTTGPTTLAPTAAPAPTTAAPFPAGTFFVVTTSTPAGSCVTTNGGTCVTDGAGAHDNNERCNIQVVQTTTLNVLEWGVEQGFDFLTIGGTGYTGTNRPQGVSVAAGSSFTWSTDSSVVGVGFTVCSSSVTIAPTAATTAAPFPAGAFFVVTASTPAGSCLTTNGGTCVTDGAGAHADNERCTIQVVQSTTLNVLEWGVEQGFDFLTINGVGYTGATRPQGATVTAGSSFTWLTDASVTGVGFTVCSSSVTVPPTTVAPFTAGSFFVVTSSVPAGSCLTTNGGTCVTDGAGNHANNERCTIQVTQSTILNVLEWGVEQGFDFLTIGGTGYTGATSPQGVSVAAGSSFTWLTDSSVVGVGFTVCANGTTAAPTAATTAAPFPAGSFFVVTASTPAGSCLTTNGGTCVTDGAGAHADNEACTIQVVQSTTLNVLEWGVEQGFDFLTIGGTGYTGATRPQGVSVAAGSSFTWSTDASVTGVGFTVCAAGVTLAPTTAAPFPAGSFFMVTSSTPAGSCLTTNGGTCVTDGAGNHADNEACTIQVVQSTTLNVLEWGVEQGFDFLTIGGTGYTGATSPQGVSVAAGSSFTWLTDSSVVGVGFTVCANGTTAAPTAATTAAPFPAGSFFVVTASVPAGSCLTTNGGTCVTDGAGAHADNERCTIQVVQTTTLNVLEWGVEQGFDFLTIGGTGYTGATRPQGVSVAAGSVFTWFTDSSVTGVGFTVCSSSVTVAPTTAAPFPAGAFFVVTSSTPAGSCLTTNGGTCVTDGAGAHADNERCTIQVTQSTTLNVFEWGVEQGFDFLTINGVGYTGATRPQNVSVTAGSSFTWLTDASVTGVGFTVCASSVTFAPTTVAPFPAGSFFVVTASVPAGACVTSNGGTCVTDGAGNHADNERCTIQVVQSTTLNVLEWGVEQGFDFLTIGGTGYTGTTRPQGVSVAAGSIFTWLTDASVTDVGFTVCAAGVTAAPTTVAPFPAGSFFVVSSAVPAGACFTTNSGTCVTDGADQHADNERCTIQVLQSTTLNVISWGVEQGFDFLTIGGTGYTGATSPQGVSVAAGSNFTWFTDASVVFEGFTICANGVTFAPTTSAPVPTGAFFVVTASTPAGSCLTTNGGTCVTDGAGAHADNERCTISVIRTTILNVTEWGVEQGFDFLTVNGVGYTGPTSPQSVVVTAGSTFTWLTDSSVVGVGFTVCANGASNAPTTAAPFPTGSFFVVTSSVPAGSCLTTNGGTCVTDGAGAHADNERCTISVLRTSVLTVTEWGVEQGFDFLTINGVGYTGANSPQGAVVTAGSTFTWLTDASVTGVGFTVCANGSTPAPTIATTAAPFPAGSFFVVTASVPAGSCLTTNGGTCVTDGADAHANNERCTIRVTQSTTLSVIDWGVEQGFDFLTVNGVGYTGANRPQGATVLAGTSFTWFTDSSVVGAGFTVCANQSSVVTTVSPTSAAPTASTSTTVAPTPAASTTAPTTVAPTPIGATTAAPTTTAPTPTATTTVSPTPMALTNAPTTTAPTATSPTTVAPTPIGATTAAPTPLTAAPATTTPTTSPTTQSPTMPPTTTTPTTTTPTTQSPTTMTPTVPATWPPSGVNQVPAVLIVYSGDFSSLSSSDRDSLVRESIRVVVGASAGRIVASNVERVDVTAGSVNALVVLTRQSGLSFADATADASALNASVPNVMLASGAQLTLQQATAVYALQGTTMAPTTTMTASSTSPTSPPNNGKGGNTPTNQPNNGKGGNNSPTNQPNNGKGGSDASSGSGSSKSSGSTSWIIAVVVIACVVIIAVIVIVMRKKSSGPVGDSRGQAAFSNPLYDAKPTVESDYAATDNDAGYMDLPATVENPIHNDGEEEDNGMYDDPENTGANDASGYMDMETTNDEY